MNSRASIRIAAYLLVYLGVPVLASKAPNQTVGSVLGIVYIILLIPFGILRMIDFYRTNDGTTLLSRIFNALFRVPLALFGLVCLMAGIAIIGWVLYNVLVERQKEYSGPHLIFGLGSFGVGVPLVLYGWFTLRSVARRKEDVTLSPEEQEEFDHEEDDEELAAKLREDPNGQGRVR
jgi:hypothetical protein